MMDHIICHKMSINCHKMNTFYNILWAYGGYFC